MHPTLMDGVEEMRAYRNVETLTFDELADLLLEFADRWPGTWEAVDALAAYLAKPHSWQVRRLPVHGRPVGALHGRRVRSPNGDRPSARNCPEVLHDGHR